MPELAAWTMTFAQWPWLVAIVGAALALHGGWRALRAGSVGPRPGIVEFGVGVAGIAMVLPRLAGVYIP